MVRYTVPEFSRISLLLKYPDDGPLAFLDDLDREFIMTSLLVELKATIRVVLLTKELERLRNDLAS